MPPILPTRRDARSGTGLRHALITGVSAVQIRDIELSVSCWSCRGHRVQQPGWPPGAHYAVWAPGQTQAIRPLRAGAQVCPACWRSFVFGARRRNQGGTVLHALDARTGLQTPAGVPLSALAFAQLGGPSAQSRGSSRGSSRGLIRVVTGRASGHGGTSSGRSFPADGLDICRPTVAGDCYSPRGTAQILMAAAVLAVTGPGRGRAAHLRPAWVAGHGRDSRARIMVG
jgi:hypothetical protein